MTLRLTFLMNFLVLNWFYSNKSFKFLKSLKMIIINYNYYLEKKNKIQ